MAKEGVSVKEDIVLETSSKGGTTVEVVSTELTARGPFRATEPDASLEKERSMTKRDWKVLGLVMAIASFVRLWRLNWPDSVVFDEVHFGGFAKKYIIGRFFFDVHPPLAKMLFAVFAFLGGFDGDSDFEFANIGDSYIPDHVPYITMRLLPAISGLLTIALCYATLRASGCRTAIAGITALVLTFENTFATESRYILLDSPLVLFVALSVYAFKRFENTVPFTRSWTRYLLLTGLGLGATVSSKWVGLFTIAWVGVLTVYQLWWIWGDLNVSTPRFVRHFASRAVFLIGVPLALYVGMFALHFFCADNMGDGADMLPRWFQASLKHNNLPQDVPATVAFGSIVSLRHMDTSGGWLHSHIQTYPAGSEQQQVTLYAHLDDNNLWRIENATEDWNPTNSSEPVPIRDGSVIRLMHIATERRLHSHDHRAPVTNQDYIFEVSGYGFEGFEGDWNDNWKVHVVKQELVGEDTDPKSVQALRTYFQLEHTMLGCLLYSKPVKLPDWGFEQQEVSCIRGGKEHNTVWMVESNINPDLPESTPLVNYPVPSFWKKFVALNQKMWTVNKELTDSHHWESRPLSWVQLRRGINMWGEKNRQVYLVGNLPVYWLIALSIGVMVVYKVVKLLLWQHTGLTFLPLPNTPWAKFDHHFNNYALGWWIHLFPSFFMARQLFLHHYLASLYFGVLMIGQFLELVTEVVRPAKLARAVPAFFLLLVVSWYIWYAPLIYGTPWTQSLCERSKFFDMDFECSLFFEDPNEYKLQAEELKQSHYSAYHGLSATASDGEDAAAEATAVTDESNGEEAARRAERGEQQYRRPDQGYETLDEQAAEQVQQSKPTEEAAAAVDAPVEEPAEPEFGQEPPASPAPVEQDETDEKEEL